MLLPTLTAASTAYLLGCINAGYYLVRLCTGGDLRAGGSGNAGARNAGRVLGRTGFALVFLADAAKGAAAVGGAAALGTGRPGMALAAVAVVAGHVFPAQLGFRGGKGASAALGALLVLDPRLALGGVLLAGLLLPLLRHAVASSLVVYALLPAGALALGLPGPVVAAVLALSALLLFAHRRNLAEILRRA